MSYINRVGNLASKPTLRHGANGPYLYARVLVTDRLKRDGEWVDGPVVAYEVFVKDDYAVHLSETAEACGHVRLHFSGRYWVDEYKPKDAPARIAHKVNADEISLSLQFTSVLQTGGTARDKAREAEAVATPAEVSPDVAVSSPGPWEEPGAARDTTVSSSLPSKSPWDTVAEIRQALSDN